MKELKTVLENIFARLERLEDTVFGDVETHAREQNSQNQIVFPHHLDFNFVRYKISGKNYTAEVVGEKIVGEKIILGVVGKTGDGNKNGWIHFAQNLDKGSKVFFEKKTKGVNADISKLKSDVAMIKEAAKGLIVGVND